MFNAFTIKIPILAKFFYLEMFVMEFQYCSIIWLALEICPMKELNIPLTLGKCKQSNIQAIYHTIIAKFRQNYIKINNAGPVFLYCVVNWVYCSFEECIL